MGEMFIHWPVCVLMSSLTIHLFDLFLNLNLDCGQEAQTQVKTNVIHIRDSTGAHWLVILVPCVRVSGPFCMVFMWCLMFSHFLWAFVFTHDHKKHSRLFMAPETFANEILNMKSFISWLNEHYTKIPWGGVPILGFLIQICKKITFNRERLIKTKLRKSNRQWQYSGKYEQHIKEDAKLLPNWTIMQTWLESQHLLYTLKTWKASTDNVSLHVWCVKWSSPSPCTLVASLLCSFLLKARQGGLVPCFNPITQFSSSILSRRTEYKSAQNVSTQIKTASRAKPY